MRRSLLVLAIAAVAVMMPLGAMADTVYTFIYQNGNVIPGNPPYGTVTLSSVASSGTTCTASEANCLKVSVSMNSPYLLHSANNALGFSASNSFNFYSSSPASTLSSGGNMDGWGSFTSRVNITGSDSASLMFYL